MTPEWLFERDSACDVLAEVFDFNVARRTRPLDWFSTPPEFDAEAVAGDSTGGMFVLCRRGTDEARLVHVGSEGRAGVLAAGLEDWLQLLVELPYWESVLKFSGGGHLREMRRAATYLEENLLDDEPEIAEVRDGLATALGLSRVADPVAALHHNVLVLSPEVPVVASDGSYFESLFNRFVVDDNPMWRNRAGRSEP